MDRWMIANAIAPARKFDFALTRGTAGVMGVAIMNGLGGPMSCATVTARWATSLDEQQSTAPTAVTTCCSGAWALRDDLESGSRVCPLNLLLQVPVV